MATLAAKAPPQGIDPALVFEYDFYDDPLYASAGGIPEAMVHLRDTAPDAFWSTSLGGYWVIQGTRRSSTRPSARTCSAASRWAFPSVRKTRR
jgi:hypothetical protein